MGLGTALHIEIFATDMLSQRLCLGAVSGIGNADSVDANITPVQLCCNIRQLRHKATAGLKVLMVIAKSKDVILIRGVYSTNC